MDVALRYMHDLYELQLKNGNHTEAAFALKLHFEALTWSKDPKDMLEAFKEYPAQSPTARKEQLCAQIIQHFDKGCTWENAVGPAKELARFYEEESFDYVKLSKLHTKIGGLYVPRCAGLVCTTASALHCLLLLPAC